MTSYKKYDLAKARKPKPASCMGISAKLRSEVIAMGSHVCIGSPTGAHWWLMSSPENGISSGVCKFCVEKREFSTNWENSRRKK